MFSQLKLLITDLQNGVCCFCGEVIRTEPHQDLVLPVSDGGTQHFVAHGDCLRAKLHPSFPYLMPKEIQDDAQ